MTKNYTDIDIDHYKKSPSSSSGYQSKEAEPIGVSKFEIQEVVDYEPKDPEIKPYVQTEADRLKISQELKKLGLKHVDDGQFPDYKDLKIPLTEEEIVEGLKQPSDSSVRWLATLATYILHKAHITLKVIHGKIFKVVS